MRKARGWLIAPSVLIGLVAVTRLGRYAANATTTSASTHNTTANNVSCFDISPHKSSLVTVAPDVQVEVLDWGGTGETMVLLTGAGDNAHVFDEFAFQFTDRFHVIGITRRGFGRSSVPAQGYDLDTRARDYIAVLDKLDLRQAVFVGHSIAGTELSKLATAYPDRVKKLVYLDALDLGSGGWSKLPQPPTGPEFTATDMESAQRLAAAYARTDGYRKPLAAICNMTRMDASGRILGPVTPPEIGAKLLAGLQPATYDRIQAPALGIFNKFSTRVRMAYYWELTPAQQAEFDRSIVALSKWNDGAIQRFRSEVKGSRVVEIPNTSHYVYIVDEPLVVREMRKFLLGNRGLRPIDPAALRHTVERLAKDMLLPGAVVIVRTANGELRTTYGVTAYRGKVPTSFEQHVRVGSNTKTWTSTVILQLVQEGKVKLDDAVSKYWPHVPNGARITIEQLLTMRSGLYNYSESPELNKALDTQPAKVWTPEQLLAIGFKHPPAFAPGAKFGYSNTNTVLLGLLAEKLDVSHGEVDG